MTIVLAKGIAKVIEIYLIYISITRVLYLQILCDTKSVNVAAIDQVVLVEPQSQRLLNEAGHIDMGIAITPNGAQILARIGKAIRIMTIIVIQDAGAHIQRG